MLTLLVGEFAAAGGLAQYVICTFVLVMSTYLIAGEFVAAGDLRGGGLLQNADPRFGAKHYGFILGTYEKQFAFGVGAGDNTGLLLSLLALLVLCWWYKVQILTLRAASQTFIRPTPPLLTVLALLVQKYKY